MQEREKILIGEKKKISVDRELYVSLDRADAIIEGGAHTGSPTRGGGASLCAFQKVRVLTFPSALSHMK